MSDGRGKSSRASTAERKHVYPVNVDREIDRMENEEREREKAFASSRAIIARESRHLPPRKLARVAYIDLVR